MKEPVFRFKSYTGDWEQRKFHEVFEGLQNNTLSRADLNYENGEAQNIHYGDILVKFGDYVDATAEKLPYIADKRIVDKFSNSFLRDGDIVIADTAEDEMVGKCTEIVGAKGKRLISGLHTIPCRPKQVYASKFLGYYMNSNAYRVQLRPLMQGVKVTSISKGVLKDTNMFLPKLVDEQGRIGAYFSVLDNLIALYQRKCEALAELKKGMLQKMFPKSGVKVPKFRFKGFNGDWEQRKLGDICYFINGDRSSNYPSTSDFIDNGIPFVGSDALGETLVNRTKLRYISTEKYQQMNGLKIEINDVLYTLRGAGFGKCSIADFSGGTVASSCVGIRCTDELDAKFLVQWLRSSSADNEKNKAVNGSTAQNISVEDMKNYVIHAPRIEEQQKISLHLYILDNLITLHQRRADALKALKKGMLQKMFPGMND